MCQIQLEVDNLPLSWGLDQKQGPQIQKIHEQFIFSDLHEIFTIKVFWYEKFENEVDFSKFWPPGVILGIQRSILGVKMVRNLGYPICMKFTPENYFNT